MGKTIGVMSLKGGVGKTSSVVALGDAISELGKKALLIDGNLSAPNLGLHLNLLGFPTLHHVLARRANIRDSIHKMENFDIIPSSILYSSKLNPLELRDRISPLKKRYDAIIIDSSPALNEETLAVMLASDGVIVVTTPDIPSLSMAMKAVRMARQRDILVIGLILNKVHDKYFDLSIEEIEDTLGVPVLAVIPYDTDIQKSLYEFMPLTQYNPNSNASTEYKKLAGVLIGEKYRPSGFREFFKTSPKKEEINREIYYHRVFG
ncbi:AAA family ATPase [Candidatus Pacearchaeota archaeon]|nr:AAA family ATPase [Candidatus Pacearchaeota archaeon]